MLLEFRLKNFRSFRDEAVLSLVASKDKTLLAENTAATGISGVPRVARSAAIYGPNASGKTNLLRGLLMMRAMVVESAILQPNQPYNIQPFRLSKETVDALGLSTLQNLHNGLHCPTINHSHLPNRLHHLCPQRFRFHHFHIRSVLQYVHHQFSRVAVWHTQFKPAIR